MFLLFSQVNNGCSLLSDPESIGCFGPNTLDGRVQTVGYSVISSFGPGRTSDWTSEQDEVFKRISDQPTIKEGGGVRQ